MHASFTQIYREEVARPPQLLEGRRPRHAADQGLDGDGYPLPTAERVLVSSLEDVMAAIARGAPPTARRERRR